MAVTEDIRRTVAKGSVIFREGEPGNCAYVVERGSVEISTQRGNERMVIARREVGEIFGEMAIVDNRPRSATVTAATDCDLLILSKEQLQDRLNGLDPVLRMVLSVILDRFRDTMDRFKSEAVGDVISASLAAPDALDARLELHRQAIERLELEQSLKRAIAQEELLLHFQPIVSCKTGRIESFEALVRWQHPERGMIPPGAFITAAEQCGLICDVSHYVVDRACAALVLLREKAASSDTAVDGPGISVNISAREFVDGAFVDHIQDCLRKYQAEPAWLTLEITESMLMENPDTTLHILERCRGIGLSISIDDFGTGYSSLSQLHRFPFETLKIDRSFVADLQGTGSSREVVRAMVGLGHGLGLKVVAEGIEEVEQASLVQLFGCDFLQGYLLSRPVPLDEALQLVGTWQGYGESAQAPVATISPIRRSSGGA